MSNGILTKNFDGEIVKFNIFDTIKYPVDYNFVLSVDIIDDLTQQTFDVSRRDALKVVINNGLRCNSECLQLNDEIDEFISALYSLPLMLDRYDLKQIDVNSYTRLLPSMVQAPVLELKSLITHLIFAYLGEGETLPAIISNTLIRV